MKYKPSVKANNAMRDEVARKLQGVIFDIDKERYNKDLNKESVQKARQKLYDLLKNFEEIVGTGDENVECFYNTALVQIDDVKDQMKSYLSGRLIQSVDDLDYTIDKWSSVLYGDVDASIAGEELQKRETSSVRRKLEEKLSELKDVQSEYLSNEKRLEAEMQNLERDIDELNDAIIDEKNDRKLNNLVSKVKAVKVKLNALNNTYRNYSFCSDLLDMIASLVGEKIVASEFSVSELNKAKAYLKVDDLKKVIAEPERAVTTLKKMEEDLKAMVPKIEANEQKISGFGEVNDSATSEAVAYQQELIAKRNAQKAAQSSMTDLEDEEVGTQDTPTVK
ncbi:unknown [Acidaminococcus sp. CAG:917]|nr:unknown [Acidaminococcus sp. CAG:917]